MTSRVRALLAAGALAGASACAGAPDYLHGAGPIARAEASLGWGLTVVSLVVSAVVAALLLVACLRRRPPGDAPLGSPRAGVRWIVVGGVVVPSLILLVAFAFTLGTLSAVAAPPRRPALAVRVVGHQWWWEVVYPGRTPGEQFAAANELHIPVGQPVRVELSTADVIHSFWVPQLAGKTDLIPGQHNVAWLQADSAGTYWEQCAEYCGTQHAHMAMRVVAESPARFAAWQDGQRREAAVDTATLAGRRAFVGAACSLCHAIRGTNAAGRVGPDLTHLASRQTIAAGLLRNTRGNLAGWIANTQTLKPGTAMPTVPLSPAQLTAITDYLETLK